MATFSFEDATGSPGTFSFEDAQTIPQRSSPTKIGADAFPDFLRNELRNADWGTRNIAGFGTALSDVIEGVKQFVGQGDKQQIDANKIIAQEAPVGAVAGNAAMTAIPFGLVGNSVGDAAKVGTIIGALQPVSGDQTAQNIVRGKIINAAEGGALAAGGQKLANMAGEYVANKTADLALRKQMEAPEMKTLQDAMDLGAVVPPSEVNPTVGNVIKESIAGKSATGQTASRRNAEAFFNKAARQDLGLTDDAVLSPDLLQARRNLAYDVGYKPIVQSKAINWDPQFIDDLKSLSPATKGGAVKSPAQGEIDDLLTSLANKNQWTGEQLIYDIRQLRQQANVNYKAAGMPGGNPGAGTLARVQDKAADALEELAGRNLGPDVVPMLRDARKYIAKSHGVEDALIEGSGNVNPQALAAQLRRNPNMDGALGVAAKFANVYRDASKPINTIGAPAVSKLNFGISPVTAASLGSVFGPVGVAAGAALPFVAPPMMRARLLSKASQNALRDIYKVGLTTRAGARALQYAPVGGTVLGLQALGQ